MKVIVILILGSFFILSCGPHRMGCGARGICIAHDNVEKSNQNTAGSLKGKS